MLRGLIRQCSLETKPHNYCVCPHGQTHLQHRQWLHYCSSISKLLSYYALFQFVIWQTDICLSYYISCWARWWNECSIRSLRLIQHMTQTQLIQDQTTSVSAKQEFQLHLNCEADGRLTPNISNSLEQCTSDNSHIQIKYRLRPPTHNAIQSYQIEHLSKIPS